MSSGGTCHECKKYECICLTPNEIKLLKGMLYFAKLYDDSNPDVGFGSNAENDVLRYLRDNNIEISNNDKRMLGKL